MFRTPILSNLTSREALTILRLLMVFSYPDHYFSTFFIEKDFCGSAPVKVGQAQVPKLSDSAGHVYGHVLIESRCQRRRLLGKRKEKGKNFVSLWQGFGQGGWADFDQTLQGCCGDT